MSKLRKLIAILIVTSMLLALFPSITLAVPQMPMQFYGTVTISGSPAPDGIQVEAKINGNIYASFTTKDGKYGYDPVFLVSADDPDTATREGGIAGETITFYVGTVSATTAQFTNGTSVQLNLAVTALPAPSAPTSITQTTSPNDNTPSLTWAPPASAPGLVSSYDVKIDSDTWASIGSATSYTHSTALADGSHTLQVRAVDKLGSAGAAGSLTFTIDVTPPTAPTNLSQSTPTSDNTPTFTWTAATDATSGIASYEVRVDTGDWTNVGNVTTYTATAAVSDGGHTFEVRAKDAAGNTGAAGSLAFTIDITPPGVPGNIARTTPDNDNIPTFTWTAPVDATSGVASYEVRMDFATWEDIGNLTIYIHGAGLSDGSHVFQVRAKDVAGNTGSAGSLVFTIDTTPPTAPTNLSKTTPDNKNLPTFAWNAATDVTSGVASYEVRIDSGSWINVGNATTYTFTTAVPDGSHTFYVRAIDTAGNTGAAGSLAFTISAAPPSAPTNLTKATPDNDNTPTFTWDAVTGASYYEIMVDSGAWTNIGNVITYTFVSIIPDGSHTSQVRARDVADNASAAASLAFTIDVTPPSTPTNIVRTTPANDNTPTFIWDAASDATSGVASYEVRIDAGDWTNIGNLTIYTLPTAVSDGSHTFEVRAKDAAGNTGTAASLIFSIDATPPAAPTNVARTTPDNDSTPTFTWDAISDAASYDVQVDAAGWTNIGNVTTYTFTTAISDGSHTFYVRARDAAGNSGAAASLAFTTDTIPPTAPANLAKTTPDNDNTPTLTWTAATDATSGVSYYEARIDSGSWANIGNVTTYAFVLALPDGSHTFEVRARDTAGNTGSAASLAFTIDTSPPGAPKNIVRTTPGNDNTPTFTWDAVAGAASYEVQVDAAGWTNIGNVTTYTFATAVSDGGHTFYVRAIDGAGNAGDAGSSAFTIDTTPPSTPTNLAKTTPDNDNTPTFTWTAATDATSGIAYYEVRVNSGDWANAGDVTTYTFATAVSDGSHTFQVRATDSAGNTGSAGSLAFTIDTTPPSIPTNLATTTPGNDNTPTFTWTAATDATSGVSYYEVRVDSGSWINAGNVTTHTTTTAFTDGNHTFEVRATDAAGNTGSAGSLAFTIDVIPPSTPTNLSRTTPANNNTPAFTWTAATDATSGVASYEVRMDSGSWASIGNVTTYAHGTALSDGGHTLQVRAKDIAGNTSTAGSLAFTIDTTPPSTPTNIAKTTPDNKSIPSFNWAAATDATSGIAYYEVRVNSGDWANAGDVTTYTFATAVSDGSHTFYVRAIDGAGNTGTAGSLAFTIDATPPTTPTSISRTTPDTDDTPTFAWDAATDVTSGVASYEVRVDEGIWANIGNVATYTFTAAIPDGSHTFYVRAIDGAGNTGTTGSLAFEVDTAPPGVPGNIKRTTPDNDNTPTFTWEAITGSSSYEVRRDSEAWIDVGNATTYTFTAAIPDGNHTFQVRAIDSAGNTSAAGSLAFTIDVTPPTTPTSITRTTPANNSTPIFTWTASTDATSGIASYEVRMDGGDWADIGNVTEYTSAAPLPDGDHIFQLRAKDAASNTGVAGSLLFLTDITPPTTPTGLARTTPDSTSTPTFAWDAATDATSGIASYEVRLDGESWTDVGNITTYTHGTALSDGSHTFQVKARDAAGNSSIPATVAFLIDTTPPTTPANLLKATPDTDDTPTFDWDAAADATSGVASYEVRLDEGHWTNIGNVTTYTFTSAIPDGSHTFDVRARDNAGNAGATASLAFEVDTTPPGVPGNIKKTTPDNDNTPTFTWEAITGSSSYEVRRDSEAWIDVGNVTTYTFTADIADGSHTFQVRAIDALGNPGGAGSLAFLVDVTPPTTPAGITRTTPDTDNTPTFTWTPATDAISGIASYEIRIDTGDWTDIGNVTGYTSVIAISDGAHTFQVRAKDAAGNTSPAGSLAFNIDVTPPGIPGNIAKTTPDNDNTPTFTWTPATDATSGIASYEVKVDSGSWVNVGNVTSYTHDTALSDGSHTFQVRAKDAAGHTGTTGSLVFLSDITPPTAPTGSLKTTPLNNNTPTFAWNASTDATSTVASYEVRVDAGSWSSVGRARTYTHYIPLTDGSHTFQVRTRDAADNASTADSLAFLVDATPPTAPTNLVKATPDTSSTPTFTWDAATDATSGVASYEVRMDAGAWASIGNLLTYTHTTALSNGSHTLQVRARDAAGNTSSPTSLPFTVDTEAPAIIVTSPNGGESWIGGSTHSITWTTIDARKNTASLYYSTDGGATWNPIASGIADMGKYSWTVPTLDTSTAIVKVTATDYAGNTGNDSSDANFTIDSAAPVISNIATTGITTTGAIISWDTSEPATSQVQYGKTTDYGLSTPLDSSLRTSRSVSLSGLSPNTEYHYKVISRDAVDNQSASSDQTFTTSAPVTGLVFSEVSASNLTSFSATISWTTSIASASQVEYGTTADYGSTSVLDAALVTGHSMSLSGLSASTTYHYRVKSDGAISDDYTFTTLGDAIPPAISGVTTANIKASSAIISWNTDDFATTQVEYGTASAAHGSYTFTTPFNPALVLVHSVGLAGLTSNTTYYYRAISQDASSNEAYSDENSFTTAPDSTAPAISSVTASALTTSSAVISWNTSEPATSQVEYGTSSTAHGSYTFTSLLHPALLTSRSVGLAGLSPSTRYYYRVISRDASNNERVSDEYSFTTLADTTPPIIANVKSVNVTSTSAIILWTTSEAATSNIVYDTVSHTSADDYTFSAPAPADATADNTNHGIVLIGLTDATAYYYRVVSTDAYGNHAVSGEYSFLTGDATSPAIALVMAVAITPTGAVIVWITDELATTQVAYSTASHAADVYPSIAAALAAYGSATPLNNTPISSHGVVLAGLTPGQTYYYRVMSEDAAGNETISAEYSFTTPLT